MPHGHKPVDYQRLLDGGPLPTPLTDKTSEKLQLDVEPAPAPLPLVDIDLPAVPAGLEEAEELVAAHDDDADLLARFSTRDTPRFDFACILIKGSKRCAVVNLPSFLFVESVWDL